MKTIKEINRNKYYLKSNVKRDVEFREFNKLGLQLCKQCYEYICKHNMVIA